MLIFKCLACKRSWTDVTNSRCPDPCCGAVCEIIVSDDNDLGSFPSTRRILTSSSTHPIVERSSTAVKAVSSKDQNLKETNDVETDVDEAGEEDDSNNVEYEPAIEYQASRCDEDIVGIPFDSLTLKERTLKQSSAFASFMSKNSPAKPHPGGHHTSKGSTSPTPQASTGVTSTSVNLTATQRRRSRRNKVRNAQPTKIEPQASTRTPKPSRKKQNSTDERFKNVELPLPDHLTTASSRTLDAPTSTTFADMAMKPTSTSNKANGDTGAWTTIPSRRSTIRGVRQVNLSSRLATKRSGAFGEAERRASDSEGRSGIHKVEYDFRGSKYAVKTAVPRL